jgi:hypothetical protein
VSDAMEAFGQHVEQEPADEFVRMQGHRLPAVGAVDPVVPPAERDAAVGGGHQPAVRDGDAVGVAREVAQHGLGSGERRLAVDSSPHIRNWGDSGPAGEVVGGSALDPLRPSSGLSTACIGSIAVLASPAKIASFKVEATVQGGDQ